MRRTAALVALAALGATAQPPPLVDVAHVIPDVVLDMRYATADNFLEAQVYPTGARCLLRPDAARMLARAAERLREQGFRLRVYDCYRPRSVQWKMWEILPRPGYVADPRKGSNHNRGAAVDLTLATLDGAQVEMPTPFDTFSPAAHHGYTGGSEASRRHREVLKEAMQAAGFRINRMEWWHYDLPGATRMPVLDVPLVPEG
jgi:D-alanyl-D-alanine dipeptidase